MNSSLTHLLRNCVLVFVYDILVYNNSFQDHVLHLEEVFKILQRDNWRVKLTKYSFASPIWVMLSVGMGYSLALVRSKQ
jgi:hypothetical protein